MYIYIYTRIYVYTRVSYMFQGSGFAAPPPPGFPQNLRNFEDSDLMPAMSSWQKLDVTSC